MTKKEWLESTYEDISCCKKCERLREVTPFPMSHICYGDLSKVKVFFVGRNPGLENDHSKISPKDFYRRYHELWWDCRFGEYARNNFGNDFIREKMFFTNICKCSSPNNSLLTNDEKNNCLLFLEIQLLIIRPKAIVTFGNEPKEIISSLNIQNSDIINLVHPAYLKYNRDKMLVDMQMKKIKKVREKYA
jgi:uracil-DNA glycosylase